jgi:hypothetical protein
LILSVPSLALKLLIPSRKHCDVKVGQLVEPLKVSLRSGRQYAVGISFNRFQAEIYGGIMKNLLKLSALAAVLVASATFASADTIQLGSYATGQTNSAVSNTAANYAGYSAVTTTPLSGVGTSFLLDPSTVWLAPIANSTYVGFAANAGPVGTVNPAFGYYTFNTTFTANGLYSGTISILADDTTSVYLDGVMIVPFGALGGNSHCADNTPTCTILSTFNIGTTALTGTNTLSFVVRQAGAGPAGGTGDPSGLDFHATLTSVPEPSTLLMLGTGLMGSAGALLRRMRS